MKNKKLLQFTSKLLLAQDWLLNNKKKIILFSCLVLLGITIATNFVHASSDDGIADAIIGKVSDVFQFFTGVLLQWVSFSLEFFLKIAKYNGYVDDSTQIVLIGWTLVRDVANMFFVVILLAIAFGTILGIENYQWNKLLGKLIFAAIFINFSKMICGLFIDVAYVFSLTFLNAIVNTAQGNVINGFHMTELVNFDPASGAATTPTNPQLLVSNMIAFLFAALLLFAIGAYLVVMLARMIVLWLLIILSPLAFIFQVMPQTQEYSKQWWSKFTKQVLVLPVMVFFLWLTFATVSGGDIATTLGVGLDEPSLITLNPTLIELTKFNNLANFFIPIAMLIVGLNMVGQMGVVGGGLTSKALDFGKKVATIATGYALGRRIVGAAAGGIGKAYKATEHAVLMNAPVVGGKAWIRRGKAVSSIARVGWSKVAGFRNEMAQDLESSTKERTKLKRQLRFGEITQDEYDKKIKEVSVRGPLGAIGRFGKRFLAGRMESGGRADKRAENYEEWAKYQEEVEKGNYSLSDTSSGQLKNRKKAEAEVSKIKQEEKAKRKVEDEVAYLMMKDKPELKAAQEQITTAKAQLEQLESSEEVNKQRAAAQTNLDAAKGDVEKKRQAAVKLEGEIKVIQDKINELGGGLDHDAVAGVVSLKSGVTDELADLYKNLGKEDRDKVDGLRRQMATERGVGSDFLDPNEKKAQTAEALRQLLSGGRIEGNADFNTNLRTLFINKFDGSGDEGVQKLVDKAKLDEDKAYDNIALLGEQQGKLVEKRGELDIANTAVEDEQKARLLPAMDKVAEWTPERVKIKIAEAEAKMKDSSLPEGEQMAARLEYNKLTGVSGTPEQIAAAQANVKSAETVVKEILGKSQGLQAVVARQQSALASAQRARAEAEAVGAVQTTADGSKIIEALNRAEFGKKQAEDFAATLKTQKLNKVFNEAAKSMENVYKEWQKVGKGNIKELDRMLKEASTITGPASADKIFIGAAVQGQKLEEAKSENTQATKKVENWAGDLSRNIPRGSRSPSTVMSSLLKETMGQFEQYERVDGSKAAVKHIFSAAMKRKSGQELDLEDRRMAMGSWMKIDSESWNDDFFDAMISMVKTLETNPDSMDGQERNIAQAVQEFLVKSGAKYEKVNGKWKTQGVYGRDFSAMLQNLASTGGDINAAVAHKKVSEAQAKIKKETGKDVDYWEVAEQVKEGGTSASTILKKSYDENQDYIQVAAREFKKNALANGHMESGLNQEFDATRGIYRFNTALEAEAGMLTEMSKRTQSQLFQAQIHSWGDFDVNTGLLANTSRAMFAAFTKNLKDEIELRGMNARTLGKLFDIHESEEVDKSGGMAHIGGQKLIDKYTDKDGNLDKAELDLHTLKDNILPKILGNAKGFGLMLQRLFDLKEDEVVGGTFKMRFASGTNVDGIDGLVNEFEKLLAKGEISQADFDQLLTIQKDWKKGNIIEPKTEKQKAAAKSNDLEGST